MLNSRPLGKSILVIDRKEKDVLNSRPLGRSILLIDGKEKDVLNSRPLGRSILVIDRKERDVLNSGPLGKSILLIDGKRKACSTQGRSSRYNTKPVQGHKVSLAVTSTKGSHSSTGRAGPRYHTDAIITAPTSKKHTCRAQDRSGGENSNRCSAPLLYRMLKQVSQFPVSSYSLYR